MTVEEYLHLDHTSLERRYEYIDGQLTLLAGGTADHATISANIISVLRGLLRGSPCRVLTSDAKVRLSETRYVYPDVTVSCNEQDRGRVDSIHFPHLVIEVLSPGTEGYDRGKKALSYRECPTIQEYMLVDTQSPVVEIFHREKNNLWLLATSQLHDQVHIASLGLSLPTTAIYEDIIFLDNNPSPE
jgi:Uma2 family endonuclease